MASPPPLFLKGAQQGSRPQWLGHVRIASPISHRTWTLASLAVGGAMIAWLYLGHYTRREHVTGGLVPQAGLWRYTAMALLFTLSPSVRSQVQSDEKPLYIDAGISSPFYPASMNGDKQALQAMLTSHPPNTGPIADALIKRMDGDFEGSSKVAQHCFDDAIIAANRPDIALVCAQIWASNESLQGHLSRWAELTMSTWQQVYPQLVAVTGKKNITYRGLEVAQAILSVPQDKQAKISINPIEKKFKLTPTGRRRGLFGQKYFINATLNGKSIKMLIDTGSKVSAISAHDAALAGLRLSSKGVPVGPAGASSTNTNIDNTKIGVFDTLSVGNIETSNQRILVIDHNESILGMDYLYRLGKSIRIGNDHLEIIPSTSTEVLSCKGNLKILADFTGFHGWQLVANFKINGHDVPTFIDTGNDSYIHYYSKDDSLKTSSEKIYYDESNINTKVDKWFYPGRVSIQTGSKTINVDLMIHPEDQRKVAWSIGSGIFNDFNLLLDFSAHHACLLPR